MTRFFILSTVVLGLSACGNNDNGDEHHHDPMEDAIADACFHGEGGPFADALATLDPEDATSSVSAPHVIHRVTLPAEGGPGYVVYSPAASGDFAFFFDGPVQLRLFDGPTEIVSEGQEAVDACPTIISQVSTFELEVGTEYTLELRSDSATECRLFAIQLAEGHDGDHHHDH